MEAANCLPFLKAIIKRGDEDFFCFSEVKEVYLNAVPEGTVKTWLHRLNVNRLKCTEAEHIKIRREIPEIAKGAFSLISKSDTERLLKFLKERAQRYSHAVPTSFTLDRSNVTFEQSTEMHSPRKRFLSGNQMFFGQCPQPNSSSFSWPQTFCTENSTGFNYGFPPAITCPTDFRCNNSTIDLRNEDESSNQTLVTGNSLSGNKSYVTRHRDNKQHIRHCANSEAKCLQPCYSDSGESHAKTVSADFPVDTFPLNKLTIPAETENQPEVLVIRPEHNVLPAPYTHPRVEETATLEPGRRSETPPTLGSDDVMPSDVLEPSADKIDVELGKGKEKCQIDITMLSLSAREELTSLEEYFSAPLNMERHGDSLQPSTLSKVKERLLTFYGYCKNVRKLEPNLSLFNAEHGPMFQEFVSYLLHTRKVKTITASRYISSLINVAKFAHSKESTGNNFNAIPIVQKLRCLLSQLEVAARREQRASAVGLENDGKAKRILFQEVLDICRSLRWEFKELSGLDQARALMNLVILLFYVTANPGRALEMTTLQIAENAVPKGDSVGNYIIKFPDGGIRLFVQSYKTAKIYGPHTTDLTDVEPLFYYLNCYLASYRAKLLMGNPHNYVFVSMKGQQFSVSALSGYIAGIFQKHTESSVRVTTNVLRKSLVTHFLSLPASQDASLRESIASVMNHTTRTQKAIYDKRSYSEKRMKGLQFFQKETKNVLLSEDDVISDSRSHSGNDSSSEDSDGYLKDLTPRSGDIVCLVSESSTERCPEIFLSRVVRISSDGNIATLAHFDETEENKFKMRVGKPYKDKVNALIFPIDVSYCSSDGLYHLRTPKIDLHREVFKAQRRR